ncbi:MAG: branched-chain amino acid ABC transporter ATP-binding protein [Nitrospira bacterium SG8_3]|nr:MAG: branched-chain amino acid ABC transporter ATP-binding protein [Nitrospira bacterium SG8_3]
MLEIKNLRVHYGRAEVLKSISAMVEDGSIVTLIGANGAGKTTTLRTISGLKKPSAGEIWFRRERIDGIPAHHIVKKGITQIPEGRMVFAPMSVLDNLKMGAHLRRDPEGIARDLEDVYLHFPVLKQRLKQHAESLSGGEQQMLAMARALMAKPKLLLMDEPSMGLAPILVEEVGKIIKNFNQSGVSIMLVEQNARMALNLADTAYIMEVGNIVSQGNAKDLAVDDKVKEAYLGG